VAETLAPRASAMLFDRARRGCSQAAADLAPGRDLSRNAEIAHRFMDRCRRAGILGIVEAVVRPSEAASRESLILDAARELSAAKPDLYKCEVPFQGSQLIATVSPFLQEAIDATAE
jgi:tagatose-1,6-bisphosphate aldolase